MDLARYRRRASRRDSSRPSPPTPLGAQHEAGHSPEPPREAPRLADQALEGARWIALGRAVVELGFFASSVALARLLTPADFGHVAVALVVNGIAVGLLQGGLGASLVQDRAYTERKAAAATGLSLLVGLLFSGLTAAFGAIAGDTFFGAGTGVIIVLASPCFVGVAASAVPQALLSRRLDFRAMTHIDVVANLIGTTASVVLAAAGVGPGSIVLGLLTTTVMTALLSIRKVRPPRPRWDTSEARAFLRFGIPASLSSVFFTATRNIDYAILSARLPAGDVGLYFRAYQLGVDYQSKISGIVIRLMFPVLSRTSDVDQFRKARARIVRVHTVLIFPLLCLLIVTAPVLIPWLYGEAWRPAVVPTQILAAAGVMTTIGTGIGPLMLAFGRPTALLANNVLSFVGFSVTVLLCSSHGLVTVCYGVLGYRLVAVTLSQYVLGGRIAGISLRQTFLSDSGPAAVAAVALVGVALGAKSLADEFRMPAVLALAWICAAGLAAHVAVLRFVFAGAWRDLRLLAARVMPARRALAASGASAS